MMKKITVALEDELMHQIEQEAKSQNLSCEAFIAQIVNRYFAAVHMIDRRDVEQGYKDCGQINLELAK